MKVLNTMISNIAHEEMGVSKEESVNMKAEMDESIKDIDETENKVLKKVNEFSKTPWGVLIFMLILTWVKKIISNIGSEKEPTMQEAFEQDMEAKVFRKILGHEEED